MWLVNSSTLQLEYFVGSNTPSYAILSHTWEDEEVTFQELAQPSAVSKKGYLKIKETCLKARRHGLRYAWIDTCCIDKSSSAELTESINSMFRWYKNAEECYAFLSDFRSGASAEDGLAACRWFTRGWTLQELIAPTRLRFYDQRWSFLGTKKDFSRTISSITNINEDVLLGRKQPKAYSVAIRMSWAAHRKTTRTEDLAYCLLGIFDVTMPMIYGEELKAFHRLQEEIIRHSNDLTVFAWDQKQEERSPVSLFALSPAAFAECNDILRLDRAKIDPVFAITNKGLRFDNFKFLNYFIPENNGSKIASYIIPVGRRNVRKLGLDTMEEITMQLRKIGPNLFIRNGSLCAIPGSVLHVQLHSFYIQTTIFNSQDFQTLSAWRCQFPRQDNLQILAIIPESHWDETDRLFFLPLDDHSLVLAALCAVTWEDSKIDVVVCIDFDPDNVIICRIFNAAEYDRELSWLFQYQRLGYDVTWDDVKADAPRILNFTNTVGVSADGARFTISASINGLVSSLSDLEIYSVNFEVETLTRAEQESVQRPRHRKAQDNSFGSAGNDLSLRWN